MERSADWMEQAQGDLAHARHDLEQGLYDWACFSSQQAAEKAAKAALQRIGGEAWGHSVADLLARWESRSRCPTTSSTLASSSTRRTYRLATQMPTRRARLEQGTLVVRRRGWSCVPNMSSGSVKVFYPPTNRPELVGLLRQQLPALAEVLPLKRVVLFGSWAKDRATAFSDIDLLVVHAGRPREETYKLVRRCLQMRGLEQHVYEAEAAQLQPTLDRMTRGGIELIPRER